MLNKSKARWLKIIEQKLKGYLLSVKLSFILLILCQLIFLYSCPYIKLFEHFLFILMSGLGLFNIYQAHRFNYCQLSQQSQRYHKIFVMFYICCICFVLINYSSYSPPTNIGWEVKSYKYGEYNSEKNGFKKGWPSGNMDDSSRRTTGAIGFSFQENNNLISLAIEKDKSFIINYSVKTNILFLAVIENENDQEITSPLLYLASPEQSQMIVNLSSFDWKPLPKKLMHIKHFKFNYNATLNQVEFYVVKLLHYIGLDSFIFKYYFFFR